MSDEELKDVPIEEFIEEGLKEEEKPDEPDYLKDIPEEDRKYAKGWNPNGTKSLEWFISDGKMMEKVDYLSKKTIKIN